MSHTLYLMCEALTRRRFDAAMQVFAPPRQLKLMLCPPSHLGDGNTTVLSRSSRWEVRDQHEQRYAQILYHPEQDHGLLLIAIEAPLRAGVWLAPAIVVGGITAAVVDAWEIGALGLGVGLVLEATRLRGRLVRMYRLRTALAKHLEAHVDAHLDAEAGTDTAASSVVLATKAETEAEADDESDAEADDDAPEIRALGTSLPPESGAGGEGM